MPSVLVVEDLKKTYPGTRKTPAVEAVRGISFTVEAGETFGLLGPNGAGKSTTLGCITSLVRPTSGRIVVDGVDAGRDPQKVKRLIAVVPQTRNLDRDLSVREVLTYHGRYFGLPAAEREARADRLLEEMQLTDKAKAKPLTLSGGLQQRAMIARALMHDPRVLLLDEPTTGLDPQARRALWDTLRGLQQRGLTIILTTHYMEEADRLCQRLAIIDHGRDPHHRHAGGAEAQPARRPHPRRLGAQRYAGRAPSGEAAGRAADGDGGIRRRCRRPGAPAPVRGHRQRPARSRPRRRARGGRRPRSRQSHPAQPRGRLHPSHREGTARMTAFFALLRRDLVVAGRHGGMLLMATLTQPILVVLVFGNILPRLHLVADEFRTVMVPGLMSITMLMAGVQGVLMPLTIDLSGSREVDERILAPISVLGVAFEKVIAGAIHAGLAGLIALPAMMLLMHRVTGVFVRPAWAILFPLVAASGVLSAAFGLTLGTRVQPRFSGLLFAVVLGPLMLFGCAYYPWVSLSVLGPVQYVFLLNPLVFMSEAMRLSVTPDVPHMPVPLLIGGLVAFSAFFLFSGARAFERRTIL
jgi:ABC-2 type transport system ATP-binding protein